MRKDLLSYSFEKVDYDNVRLLINRFERVNIEHSVAREHRLRDIIYLSGGRYVWEIREVSNKVRNVRRMK